jgi:hypothetical protein
MKTVKIEASDVIYALKETTDGQVERLQKGFNALLMVLSTQQLLDMYVDIKGNDIHYHNFDDQFNYEERVFGLEDSE